MKYVYVSGPYSQPDQALNVRAALDAGTALMRNGLVPFVPHLTHFWHLVHPADYEDWLAHDLAWVERCDVVLRLPGVSPGADRKVAHAETLGIPVIHDGVEGLVEFVTASNNALDMPPADRLLLDELRRLVERHGLSVVHTTLRDGWDNDYCGNCGCPVEQGRRHHVAGLGRCTIEQLAAP